ncbi:CoA transferase [Pseudorhodoferax sp. Leaf267]|uniref:CoA transferase n=1 Tax=Pseudorhodoferax sp. Leaf267 TaxID=1736316 RepID=UPI000700B023|nr:CoA transferase [Pseudorhodoferax sp. Leaf267]KQP13628.1 acyl-CoA transferase [Pseudorhodoferax sp. Leaf267]
MPEPADCPVTHRLLAALWQAPGGDTAALHRVRCTGAGALPSVFHTSALATAAVAVAGLAASALVQARHGRAPAVQVDRRLASFWFGLTLRPEGWLLPSAWDAVAGDYATADGWIRLHTNAPHHRAAALRVLQAPAEREQVAHAVSAWTADALEAAVLAAGGCAGSMRSLQAWAAHPQGLALQAEPLLHRSATPAVPAPTWTVPPDRPLAGVRVLDLTRVMAGPVATRLLAGWGADVLRVDAPDWNEPALVPELTLGKRCMRLDLRSNDGRARLVDLLRGADVLVHGLRPGALEGLGLGPEARHTLCPGLVDVSLSAYGFTGPWRGRRGFDSIVQMSCGIADAGMRQAGRDRPVPLPVQALDQATGYLLAAAVLRGLQQRLATGAGSLAQASLARTALLLTDAGLAGPGPTFAPEQEDDLAAATERTAWGPARRLRPPLQVEGMPLHWAWPARDLGHTSTNSSWLA